MGEFAKQSNKKLLTGRQETTTLVSSAIGLVLEGLEMAYASNMERFRMISSAIFDNPCPFVVRFEKEGHESELIADDIDHALNIQKFWIDRGANYVEIFRVFEYDGSLNPTIGAYRKDA